MLKPGEVVYGKTKSGVPIVGGSLKFIVANSRKRIKDLNDKLGDRAINAAITAALVAAGNMWIRVFLPKRFNKGYAEGVLQYKATEKYKSFKRKAASTGKPYRHGGDSIVVASPQDTPFVLTGRSRSEALSGARVKASVMSDGRCRLAVTVPRGRITMTPQNSAFKYVPAIEKARVAQEVMSAMSRVVIPNVVSGDIGNGFKMSHIDRMLSRHTERSVGGE